MKKEENPLLVELDFFGMLFYIDALSVSRKEKEGYQLFHASLGSHKDLEVERGRLQRQWLIGNLRLKTNMVFLYAFLKTYLFLMEDNCLTALC